MEKSVDAFRTISEVADELDLPQHVLRFWETRFTQIRPLKRAGGRRFYRPADVVLLRSIRQLLYDEGYTIKGVQRLLRDKSWLKDKACAGGDDPLDTDTTSPHDPGPAEPGLNAESAEANGAGAGTAEFAHPAEPERDEIRDALTVVEECRRILLEALGRSA